MAGAALLLDFEKDRTQSALLDGVRHIQGRFGGLLKCPTGKNAEAVNATVKFITAKTISRDLDSIRLALVEHGCRSAIRQAAG